MDLPIDEVDAPLSTVTFAVVDLETTGGSPWTCGITEVGAVKLKGGECIGTFHTLVNPGVAIPPEVTYLTGITTSMVRPAPLIDAVLPALLEFLGGAVIVGHNVRFDISFLGAAADRLGYPRPANLVVDTCLLARRLLGDEVPDCKLSTVAAFFATTRLPTHRAFDDAAATGEVLHGLLERAGSLGIVALDDLVEFPAIRGRMALAKLRLTRALPRQPGVYVFRNAGGEALFVGAAANLRRTVRSYFTAGGDDRRRVGALIREVTAIEHSVHPHPLEARVQAIRLRRDLSPRYNSVPRWSFLKLTLNERFPRLTVVRKPKAGDGCVYLGPMPSAAAARSVAAAIESVVALRANPDLPTPGAYGALVDAVVEGLTLRPDRLIDPLARKMACLAADRRFEEAGVVRDRAAALSGALHRQRRFDLLRGTGRIVVAVPGEGGAILEQGRLTAAWVAGDPVPLPGTATAPCSGPVPVELADELACVAGWLDERWDQLDVLVPGGGLDWPRAHLSPFDPEPPSWAHGGGSGAARRWWDAVA